MTGRLLLRDLFMAIATGLAAYGMASWQDRARRADREAFLARATARERERMERVLTMISPVRFAVGAGVVAFLLLVAVDLTT